MITVLGAGSGGCFVGGMLAAAGQPVTLIGREQMVRATAQGLCVHDLSERAHHARPIVTADPTVLRHATIILVCVKSADTHEAAGLIKLHASKDAHVISLQNGLTNVAVLRDVLGQSHVTAGMVGFNVVRHKPDTFAQTTEGALVVDPSGKPFVQLFGQSFLEVTAHQNMKGVQWSKLLLNLNNAINVLSGLPLRAQLQQRGWRRVLAECIAEGLSVAKAEGVRLERLGKIHPRLLPALLRLPNAIFLRIAQPMMQISPTARSSMADDYDMGRVSEVAWLNGFIVDQAHAHSLRAPVNARVVGAINAAFADADRPALSHEPSAFLT